MARVFLFQSEVVAALGYGVDQGKYTTDEREAREGEWKG